MTHRILWEGERPSTADAQWLLTHGVGSIVSIQVDDRATFRDIRVPPDLVLSIPNFRIRRFNAVRLFSRTDVDERVAVFLAIMRNSPKPVYLHCHFGVDRALLLATAYRILIQGLDPDQAIKDISGLHSPWLPIEIEYLHSLTPERRLNILRRVDYWVPRVRPSAIIRCSQGRCHYLRMAPSTPERHKWAFRKLIVPHLGDFEVVSAARALGEPRRSQQQAAHPKGLVIRLVPPKHW